MAAKDDNERLKAGTLPSQPEDDAVIVAEESPRVFGDKWKTLKQLGGGSWSEWFRTAPPRRRWLLERPCDRDSNAQYERTEGVLPLGKVGMLTAAGGVGKTTALVQLALAVAVGHKWLDTFTTPNPGHVLLALGEEDAEEVRRRLYNAARLMKLTEQQQDEAADRIVVLPLAGTPVGLTESDGSGNVAETEALRDLRACLRECGFDWRLVVLDPLSRFAGCDTEKDNAAATRFIEAVETLVNVPGGPTVLLAHHTTKNSRSNQEAPSASDARGASALTDGVRWVANLESKTDDRAEFKVTKSNYSRRGESLYLVRDENGALRAETSKERDDRHANDEQKSKKSKPNATPKPNANLSDEDLPS